MNATNFLILLNSIIYVTTNNLKWSFIPKAFWDNMNKEAPKLLTSAFMHADTTHLVFNMLSLYLFGTIVEKFMGSTSYLIFYLFSCVLGSYVYAVMNASSPIMTLGASGAISAIMAIYFLLLRKTGSFMNVVYFELMGLMFGQFTGINYMAHLIGLAIGSVYYFAFN